MTNQRTLRFSRVPGGGLLRRGLSGDFRLWTMLLVAWVAGPLLPAVVFLLAASLPGPLGLLAYPAGFAALLFGWTTTACFLLGFFGRIAFERRNSLWRLAGIVSLPGIALLALAASTTGVWAAVSYLGTEP